MKTSSIKKFEDFKDVLVYIAVSPHPVSARELEENVTELSRGQLNIDLTAMVHAGYLLPQGGKSKHAYTATDKAKQLFGIAH